MRGLIAAFVIVAMPVCAAEDPHAHHQMPTAPSSPATGEPTPPTDFAADRIYGAGAMAAARHQLRHEHGDHVFSRVMIDTLEYAAVRGDDGYRWGGEAWVGGDINRAVFKTEGEGTFGGDVHEAEVQALYSRAIGPYFDVQTGVRYDPEAARGYAVLGLEGLAPYWFEVEAAAFLSDRGDLLARVEASYDLLVTQRVILEPRAEVTASAQDVRAQGLGRGISELELGLRLRAEFRREFAPYVGISYSRKTGRTADFARAAGEDVSATAFVIGIRTWF